MRQRDKRPALLLGALRALGLLLLMLDGGKAKLPRPDRRRSPPTPPPSVAAAMPPLPLLRRGRRRLWLRLGDQRKLINEPPTGAPPVQLAPQLRPRVRLRRRRGFGLRRFFGAAGLGRPRVRPAPVGLAFAPASPSVALIALVALNRRVAFVFLRHLAPVVAQQFLATRRALLPLRLEKGFNALRMAHPR